MRVLAGLEVRLRQAELQPDVRRRDLQPRAVLLDRLVEPLRGAQQLREVLAELGKTEAEIDALVEAGVAIVP